MRRAYGTASTRAGGLARFLLRLAATLVVSGLVPAAGASQELPRDIRTGIERRAAAMVDSLPMPGLAVGVVLGDSLDYSEGFGVADRETGTGVDDSTLFQVGSVTKPVTATLAGILVNQGLVGWDDRVVDHLPPGVAVPDSTITIRHLAMQTSGLPGYPPNLRRKHEDYPILAYSHFELHRGLAEAEIEFRPGRRWSYSNFGYGVLGHVLEHVSARPFETLLEDEILDPLGMRSTTVTLWPELRAKLATPYYHDEESGELRRYTPWEMGALAPAGGITSSVEDLGRFVAFLFRVRAGEESALGAESLAMQQSPLQALSEKRSYGMGWFVEDRTDVGRVVFHGGGVDGYTSWLALAPEHEVGVILLVNSGAGSAIVDLSEWILRKATSEGDP